MQGLLPVCASIVEPNIPHQKSVTTAFHENYQHDSKVFALSTRPLFLPSSRITQENSDESPIGTRPFSFGLWKKNVHTFWEIPHQEERTCKPSTNMMHP
jgi:hypothetical protein